MPIREASHDDVDSIHRVAEASWETDYPDVLSRESIEAGVDDWYSEERIRESITWSRSHMLVYEHDGEAVGFVHADLNLEDDVGHVLRVYVHPDHRRGGIGGELLEAACRALFDEGAGPIRAMALESNELGDQFYRNFGFEPVSSEEVMIGEELYRETTYELREETLASMATPSED